MKIKIHNDISNNTLYSKIKKLIDHFERNNNYGHTSIFSYIDFIEVYIKSHRLKKKDIFLISVENNNKEIILFIPLMIKNYLNVNIFSFIGGNKSDYSCCLYNKEFVDNHHHIFKRLKTLLGKKYIIIINSLIDKNLLRLFTNNFCNNISFVKDKYSFLDSYDYEFNISKKLKKEIIRCEKKLKKLGTLKIVKTTEAKSKNEIIDFLVKTKNEQYENSGSNKLDEYSENFYRRLVKTDIVDLTALYFNKVIIAAHLGLKTKINFSYILPVYNYDFRKYSPGWILLFKLLEMSKINHQEKFDLTVGDETYKNRLNPKKGEIYYLACSSNKFLFFLMKLNILLMKIKIFLHKVKTKYIFR